MDLQKLTADLAALEPKFRARNGTAWQLWEETRRKVGRDGYTEEDRARELVAARTELNTIYHPRNAIRPLLDEVMAAYVVVSAEERAAIRKMFNRSNCGADGLFGYILECVECLETPADVDAFRLALIAASIQDCAHDFRDTHAVLAELAVAAVKAGIVMEPDCAAIAALSSDKPSTGGCRPMKIVLAEFPVYAPTAVRLY